MSVTYDAVLDMSENSVHFLSGLLEGARVPPNAMSMPPWRNRWASSMLSAPATVASGVSGAAS